MEWYIIVLLIVVGILSGFINTIAGSGSLLTLPVLYFLGLEPNIANGTLRIGILTQSLTAVTTYKQQQIFEWKDSYKLIISAVAGSIFGAIFAVNLSSEIMELVIAGLFIFMIFLLIFKPEKWITDKEISTNKRNSFLQIAAFFLIGLYGGFIQVGVGFFLLAGLVLGAGYELVRANALKSLIVLAYTPFALTVFIVNNQVDYPKAFILAIGNIFGAWLAAKLSIKKGAKFIRYFLILVITISAIKIIISAIDNL